jgi:hypothetical protein
MAGYILALPHQNAVKLVNLENTLGHLQVSVTPK